MLLLSTIAVASCCCFFCLLLLQRFCIPAKPQQLLKSRLLQVHSAKDAFKRLPLFAGSCCEAVLVLVGYRFRVTSLGPCTVYLPLISTSHSCSAVKRSEAFSTVHLLSNNTVAPTDFDSKARPLRQRIVFQSEAALDCPRGQLRAQTQVRHTKQLPDRGKLWISLKALQTTDQQQCDAFLGRSPGDRALHD